MYSLGIKSLSRASTVGARVVRSPAAWRAVSQPRSSARIGLPSVSPCLARDASSSSGDGLVVAIAGATGSVGLDLLQVLEERSFPVSRLVPLASSRSAGRTLKFAGDDVTVEELTDKSFDGVDVAFFAAGGAQSREFAPAA